LQSTCHSDVYQPETDADNLYDLQSVCFANLFATSEDRVYNPQIMDIPATPGHTYDTEVASPSTGVFVAPAVASFINFQIEGFPANPPEVGNFSTFRVFSPGLFATTPGVVTRAGQKFPRTLSTPKTQTLKRTGKRDNLDDPKDSCLETDRRIANRLGYDHYPLDWLLKYAPQRYQYICTAKWRLRAFLLMGTVLLYPPLVTSTRLGTAKAILDWVVSHLSRTSSFAAEIRMFLKTIQGIVTERISDVSIDGISYELVESHLIASVRTTRLLVF
jgi:hypothetical protein